MKSVYQDLGVVFVDENQFSQAVQIICWKKCLPLWLHSLQLQYTTIALLMMQKCDLPHTCTKGRHHD